MKRFMNTVFVFLTLTALMLGAFGASPAYAADDQTRPQVLTFGPLEPGSVVVDDAFVGDGMVKIQGFTAEAEATHYMVTFTSEAPDPAESGWIAGAIPATVSAYLPEEPGTYTVYPWVKDAAGNVSEFYYGRTGADPEIKVDVSYKPVTDVSCDGYHHISNPDTAWTNSVPLECRVWFRTPYFGLSPNEYAYDNPVKDFVVGDVVLGGTATTRGAATNWTAFLGGYQLATGSGYADTFYFDIPYTATVSGTATISVAAGAATDKFGNANNAYDGDTGLAGDQPYVTNLDIEPPTATISGGTASGFWFNNMTLGYPDTGYSDYLFASWYMIKGVPKGAAAPAAPLADDDDWLTATSPVSWKAPVAGEYDLYPYTLDLAGNVSTTSAKLTTPMLSGPAGLLSFERYDPKEVYPDTACTSWSSTLVWDPETETWVQEYYCSGNYWTNEDTLVFLATFSEGVKDVNGADFELNTAAVSPSTFACAPTVAATVSAVADDHLIGVNSVPGSEWLVTVSGGDLANCNGSVNLNLKTGYDIKDLKDNAVTGSGPSGATNDQTYQVDNIAPVVTAIVRTGSANTESGGVGFNLSITEAATGSGMDDSSILGGGLGLFTTNLTGAYINSGSCTHPYGGTPPTEYDYCYVYANTGTGNGTLRLDVVGDGFTDLAGNSAAPFTVGEAYTVVKGAAPTVPVLVSPKNNSLTPSMTKPKKPLLPEPLNPWQPVLDWKDSAQVQKLVGSYWFYEIQLNVTNADGTVWTNFACTDGSDEDDPLTGLSDSQIDFTKVEYDCSGHPFDGFPQGATVVWKVRAYNANNQYSAWSKPFTFRTPYAPPQQTAPRNGKMLETTAPEISWETVTGATGYTVTVYECTGVATATTCPDVVKGKSFKVKAPAHTLIPKGLKPEAYYAWTVKAEGKNSDKVASVSGRLWFKTSKVTPMVPTLVLPKNNALVTAGPGFQTLSWKQVVAGKKGEPAAHHYEVQVSVDPNFVKNYEDSQLNKENFSDFRVSGTKVATVSVDFLNVEPGRTYYWRVRAWSDDTATTDPIYSGWSKATSFKVKYTAPWIDYVDDDATKNPVLYWGSDNGLWKAYKVMICAGTDLTCKKALKTYTVNAPVEEFTVNPATEKKPLPVGKYTWKVQITGVYGSVFSPTTEIGTFEIK